MRTRTNGQTEIFRGVATSRRTEEGTLIFRYHSTDIVKWNPVRGTVVLQSGGWQTATTKNHMNQIANENGLPFRVIQKKKTWSVQLPQGSVPFEDGMTLKIN